MVIDELKAIGFQNVYYGDGEYDTEKFYLEIELKKDNSVSIYVSVENDKLCDVGIEYQLVPLYNITTISQLKKLIEALKGE